MHVYKKKPGNCNKNEEKLNNRDANEQEKYPSVRWKKQWKAQAEGIYLPKQRSKSTQRKKKKKTKISKKHQKVKGGSNMLGSYAKKQ